jgi:Xaa-Pro aminopeptidase
MNRKIEAIKVELARRNIQGMIISNPENIKYIIGVDCKGELLLTDSNSILIIDKKYIEEVNSKITIDDQISVYENGTVSDREGYDFFEYCPRVGIEENYITYAGYTQILRKYRIKEPAETEYLIEKIRERRVDLR